MAEYFYAKRMREWSAQRRASGEVVAASDLDVAADHMDRLAAQHDELKASLKFLSDPARFDKTVTVYANAALAAIEKG